MGPVPGLALILVAQAASAQAVEWHCQATICGWLPGLSGPGTAGFAQLAVTPRRQGSVGPCEPEATQRPRRPPPRQMTMPAALVGAGPFAANGGILRWRRRDLHARIAAVFGTTLHQRTVGRQSAGPGFRRPSVRPQHPGSCPEACTQTLCEERRKPPASHRAARRASSGGSARGPLRCRTGHCPAQPFARYTVARMPCDLMPRTPHLSRHKTFSVGKHPRGCTGRRPEGGGPPPPRRASWRRPANNLLPRPRAIPRFCA